MPRARKKKKSKHKAPATILFTSEKNDKNHRQICIYAQCQFSDRSVGPIWGHTDNSIKRALATLTEQCDCPARFHQNREQQGMRITKQAKSTKS